MNIQNYHYLNTEPDVSHQFATLGNVHFIVSNLTGFHPQTGKGSLNYERRERKGRMSFNGYTAPFEPTRSWSFPPAYPDEPAYPFLIEIVSDNVVRIRTTCVSTDREIQDRDSDSLMLDGKPGRLSIKPHAADENHAVYRTAKMEVEIQYNPFRILLKDKEGKILTRTLHSEDSMCLQNYNPMPFSYVRSSEDMHKYPAVSLSLYPNEHFYGCGESFTALDKAGQKVMLWTVDAHGVGTSSMYKPIPFYFSSRGYGVFFHTSSPTIFDFGHEYAEAQTAYLGDENIDFFLIAGTPKEILDSYTELTGKGTVPPLWSFGLWMSRITYKSEKETREVAAKLQEHQVPCDVIHLDTGWFEEDWNCDYRFSESRFEDAEKMIADLNKMGYQISLWQLPYFTPANPLFQELLDKNLVIRGRDGQLPTDDAILDFSNPDAVAWYQAHIKKLLKQGVAAIKADFGEAAPLEGLYHSGKTGFTEHNLYPLRYNKAVYDVTQKVHGEGNGIIWGRSAWAGSQRYPLHWGGDAENTDVGMLASLRGGLSFGNSGFSFWSHDAGGFVRKSPEELYTRWTFFGIFTSHMRCHGAPPKEPWAYSEDFLNTFRKLVQLRYRLIPYIYAQSVDSASKGLPLLRAMIVECPDDPACATLEDQYFFGNDMLIAPLFEECRTRQVYLPRGSWMELGTNQVLEGGQWHKKSAAKYPGLAFVKAGAVIPMAAPVLTTRDINWDSLELVHFDDGAAPLSGLIPDYKKGKISSVVESMKRISSQEVNW